MKWLILLATVLLAGHHVAADDTDEVDLGERQYDCQYMWMMMNGGGPQATGLGVGLLVCVGVVAAMFSADQTWTISKRL